MAWNTPALGTTALTRESRFGDTGDWLRLRRDGEAEPDRDAERAAALSAILAAFADTDHVQLDVDAEPRDGSGRWTAGAGGGTPEPKLSWHAKVGAALRSGTSAAIEKIRSAPGAIRDGAMKQIGLVKNAALGINAAVHGQPMSDVQKSALRTVAVKVATKVALGALGAALPGIGHAFGKVLEHAGPRVVEALAHHIAKHAAEHVVEHALKHGLEHGIKRAVRVTTSIAMLDVAVDSDNGVAADWLLDRVCDGLQDALERMTPADWEAVLAAADRT